MTLRLRYMLVICLAFGVGRAAAIDWPVAPQDVTKMLGNSYGEYQNYNNFPYYHPGIDIMVPAGTPVYAVKAGYVKAVLTISADLHWRVAIGDSAGADECDGWLYAHLDRETIAVYEGEWVEEGQYLGDIVYWPVAAFHHLHFVKIRHFGVTWDSDWMFIANPLDELEVIDDPDPPVFVNAYQIQKFAFCQNESASYFSAGESLSGDVDVICCVYDRINHPHWMVTPYKVEYRIAGDSAIPWTTSVCFTGRLDWDQNVDAVYQDDAFCNSKGDYDYRRFYFNLTNTDGDGIAEAIDRQISWHTADFHNGQYRIYARASDRFGNSTVDSMTVMVNNLFALSGMVTCADGNPRLDGTCVSVEDGHGLGDTTDAAGDFYIPAVGGGSQLIWVSRAGYERVDTVLLMNQHHNLNVDLIPAEFVRGDANFDGGIDVSDVVYIINFVFKGGPEPMPYFSADANSDGTINVADAVFLINYIFKDGPAPGKIQKSIYSYMKIAEKS